MRFLDTVIGEWVIIGLSALTFIVVGKVLFAGTPLRMIPGLPGLFAAA